ncbi:MAG: hypothetical protein V4456_14190 [Bacteroidota bacterium]|jgi:hypothetical protein|uniref:hypothetical protein n=1 Tax=Mucilaginibacter inviolabilis TaxID=2714892 RepID=UPI00140A4FEF|nr:hypothetical protein [Mucilaginibacter inviolabilis]NHA05829.1 hypothetical protein [Mucilaginibacter inviolabilis]
MKVIINNINIYFNTGYKSTINIGAERPTTADIRDFSPHIVVNDGVVTDDNAFLERLKERLMQSEQEVKDFLEKYNTETR